MFGTYIIYTTYPKNIETCSSITSFWLSPRLAHPGDPGVTAACNGLQRPQLQRAKFCVYIYMCVYIHISVYLDIYLYM